jgi:hypothetical protein
MYESSGAAAAEGEQLIKRAHWSSIAIVSRVISEGESVRWEGGIIIRTMIKERGECTHIQCTVMFPHPTTMSTR